MQLRGLEPLPGNPDMNLNHARMPIPPQLLILRHNFVIVDTIERK